MLRVKINFSPNFLLIFRPLETSLDVIYYWFSLLFLIGRTLAVSLFAAQVYDESKKPSDVLCRVQIESWCSEAARFSDEVNSGVTALSGMKFFYLTRTAILTVAGTIATYELVLFQYHGDHEPIQKC